MKTTNDWYTRLTLQNLAILGSIVLVIAHFCGYRFYTGPLAPGVYDSGWKGFRLSAPARFLQGG